MTDSDLLGLALPAVIVLLACIALLVIWLLVRVLGGGLIGLAVGILLGLLYTLGPASVRDSVHAILMTLLAGLFSVAEALASLAASGVNGPPRW